MRVALGLIILVIGILLIISYFLFLTEADSKTELLFIGAGLTLFSIFAIFYDIKELDFWKFRIKTRARQFVKKAKEKTPTVTKKEIEIHKKDKKIPGALAEDFKIMEERLLLSQKNCF